MIKLIVWLSILIFIELVFGLLGISAAALLFPIIALVYAIIRFIPDDEKWFN